MHEFSPGRYRVKPCGQGFTKSSTDNPTFELRFFVIGKYDIEKPDGELIPCPNEQRTYFKSITEKTAQWLVDDLASLGWEGSSFTELDPQHPLAHIFKEEFDALCKVEEYKGKRQERWSISSSKEVAQLATNDLKNLDTLFGHLLSGAKTTSASKNESRSARSRSPF